jgi:hypothetical protein
MKNLIICLFLAVSLSPIATAQKLTYKTLKKQCTVSSAELQTIQTQIRRVESALNPQNQIDLAESIFTAKSGCFTSVQIKSIVKSIVNPESQLAVAKLGYDRVSDPANYSVVAGAFSFPPQIEAFNNFLSSKN